MNTRAALAFILSLLVILAYNAYLTPKAAERLPLPVEGSLSAAAGNAVSGAVPRKQQKPTYTGEEIFVETDALQITFTSAGARMQSCRLKKYTEEKTRPQEVQQQIDVIEQDVQRYPADGEKQERLLREKNKWTFFLEKLREAMPVELVAPPAVIDNDFAPAIVIPGAEEVSLAVNAGRYEYTRNKLLLNEGRRQGELEFNTLLSAEKRVKKTYTFARTGYGCDVKLQFTGWKKEDFPEGHFLLFLGPDIGLPQPKTQGAPQALIYFRGPASTNRGWIKKERYEASERNMFVRRELYGNIGWIGLENKYFLTAVIPGFLVEKAVVEKNQYNEQKTALKIPWNNTGIYSLKLYYGPKKADSLKEIDTTLATAIDYGFWSPVARLIYQILVFFSRWTKNFGWAIVLLCFFTKIIFYPLSQRSFASMEKMQRQMKTIQPEIERLKEAYKDNPQKLNKEIMALYQKKGMNPLSSCQSGCIPLVLQMPVFFALYAVLYNSIELRGTPFLGWIQDLSAKDPYYILPILMGLSMVAQQKLSGTGMAGNMQQDQAKLMAILMPVFLTWMFANLPSGVVLYWFTFNVLTAGQQMLMKKERQAV